MGLGKDGWAGGWVSLGEVWAPGYRVILNGWVGRWVGQRGNNGCLWLLLFFYTTEAVCATEAAAMRVLNDRLCNAVPVAQRCHGCATLALAAQLRSTKTPAPG